MKEKITLASIGFLLTLLFVPAVLAAEKVLAVEFTVSPNDTAAITNVYATSGSPTASMEGEYTLSLLDLQQKQLQAVKFDVSFYIETTSGVIPLNQSSSVITLPFSDSGKVVLKRGTKTLAEKSIALCNSNNVCEAGENFFSCRDCASGSKDGVCDKVRDGTVDPDCPAGFDPDSKCNYNGKCEAGETNETCRADCAPLRLEEVVAAPVGIPSLGLLTSYWYIILGVIVLVAIIVIAIRRHRRAALAPPAQPPPPAPPPVPPTQPPPPPSITS